MKFEKPATSIEQQIYVLQQRGLVIDDNSRAAHYLKHIGYYHLRPYWEHFTDQPKKFRDKTNFEQVLELYSFDRNLRLLILDAIERVEVSLRSSWVYCIANKYNSHGYLEQDIFKKNRHPKLYEELKEDIKRSKEKFILHYKNKYTNPSDIPIWMVSEIISFGQLSKWIKNLKSRQDRQKIAYPYKIDEVLLTSSIHYLTPIRNICAHHSRLWDRRFDIRMKIPKNVPPKLKEALNYEESKSPQKIYNALVMLSYFMDIISSQSKWRKNLIDLIKNTPLAKPSIMGFPTDWQKYGIWK